MTHGHNKTLHAHRSTIESLYCTTFVIVNILCYLIICYSTLFCSANYLAVRSLVLGFYQSTPRVPMIRYAAWLRACHRLHHPSSHNNVWFVSWLSQLMGWPIDCHGARRMSVNSWSEHHHHRHRCGLYKRSSWLYGHCYCALCPLCRLWLGLSPFQKNS